MPVDPVSLAVGSAGGILDGIGSIISARAQSKAAERAAERAQQMAAQGQGIYGEFRQYGLNNLGDVNDTSNKMRNNASALLYGSDGNYEGSQLSNYQKLIDTMGPEALMAMLNDPYGAGMNPEMLQMIQQMGGSEAFSSLMNGVKGNGGNARGNRQTLFDRANELANGAGGSFAQQDAGSEQVSNRGVNPFNQTMMDRGSEMVNRSGVTENLNFGRGAALDILGAQGKNADSRALVGAGRDIVANGGRTADQQNVFKQSMQDFAGGGHTDGTRGMTAAGMGMVNSGGRTDASRYLVNRGQELSSENPLLSMEDTMSFARDTAGRGIRDRSQQARAQALARGGGAGSTVFNGQQADGLYEFADQAAEAESAAMQKALVDRQSLGLNQLNQGLNSVGAGGGMENTRVGLGSGLAQAGEGVAANRYSTAGGIANSSEQSTTNRLNAGGNIALSGLSQEQQAYLESINMMPKLDAAAANNANVFGGLGIAGSGDQVNRMNAGSSMISNGINNRNNSISTANNVENSTDNTEIQNNQLLRALFGDERSAAATQFGSMLNGGQFGQSLNQNRVQAGQTGLGNTQSMINFLNGQLGTSLSTLLASGGQNFDMAKSGLNLQAGGTSGANGIPGMSATGGLFSGLGQMTSQIPSFNRAPRQNPAISMRNTIGSGRSQNPMTFMPGGPISPYFNPYSYDD